VEQKAHTHKRIHVHTQTFVPSSSTWHSCAAFAISGCGRVVEGYHGLLMLQHRGTEAGTVTISASILLRGWNRATSVLECTRIDQESWLWPWKMCRGHLLHLSALIGSIAAPSFLYSRCRRIPFYNEIKLLVVLWMACPPFNGALWIYQQAEPTLEAHVKHFESILKPVSKQPPSCPLLTQFPNLGTPVVRRADRVRVNGCRLIRRREPVWRAPKRISIGTGMAAREWF